MRETKRAEINLTDAERAEIRKVAEERLADAQLRNKNAHGRVGRDIGQEEKAAAAEFAVSRLLGLSWASAPGVYRTTADVGQQAEVKMIDRPPAWGETPGRRLLLRDADVRGPYAARAYFLVWVLSPSRLVIVGWCWGHEAQSIGAWETPTPGRPPALLVNPIKLRSAESAKGVVS